LALDTVQSEASRIDVAVVVGGDGQQKTAAVQLIFGLFQGRGLQF
jgi:hypothetical protein